MWTMTYDTSHHHTMRSSRRKDTACQDFEVNMMCSTFDFMLPSSFIKWSSCRSRMNAESKYIPSNERRIANSKRVRRCGHYWLIKLTPHKCKADESISSHSYRPFTINNHDTEYGCFVKNRFGFHWEDRRGRCRFHCSFHQMLPVWPISYWPVLHREQRILLFPMRQTSFCTCG